VEEKMGAHWKQEIEELKDRLDLQDEHFETLLNHLVNVKLIDYWDKNITSGLTIAPGWNIQHIWNVIELILKWFKLDLIKIPSHSEHYELRQDVPDEDIVKECPHCGRFPIDKMDF